MARVPVSSLDLCRPEARSLPIYNAGVSERTAGARYDLARVTKLASNENPFGVSPSVIETLASSFGRIYRYPDPHCTALRDRLHALNAISADRIVFGNGSEDIIEMLCKALLSPGDRVVTLAPTFGLHEIFPLMMGATVDKVRVNTGFGHDLARWRRALTRAPVKLVMLSTPSNPVGCILRIEEFRQLIDAAPADTVLVVDEAYHEYAAPADYPDSLKLLSAQARPWIVLRTFSKAHSLAGLRIGYGIASDAGLVSILDRVRTPFNVNSVAQDAAMAALNDTDHLQATVTQTIRERELLADRLESFESTQGYGLRIAPSSANFLFLDTATPSREITEALMRLGVIVKPWLEPGFETFIRVTVGRREDNEHFMEAFERVMRAPPYSRQTTSLAE